MDHIEKPTTGMIILEDGIEKRDIASIKANAFLRQRYPLTNQGLALKAQVHEALNSKDRLALEELSLSLPTVEVPHLEYFEDIQLTPEDEDFVFGRELQTVQTTKGCSHDCMHCAAGASPKIEATMPFAAVLRIAEKKKAYDRRLADAVASWKKIGGNPPQTEEEDDILHRKYQGHMLRVLSGVDDPTAFELLADTEGLVRHPISNYDDSDDLDYRDPSFVHEDGTPADFGDVFQALASELRPIHMTIAVWSKKNHFAQRAVDKIVRLVEQNPKLIYNPRISINRYDALARRDLDLYRESVINAIQTLGIRRETNQRLVALLTHDPSEPQDQIFIAEVVRPVEKFISEHGYPATTQQIEVSHFSGRMSTPEGRFDQDVMACVAGVFISPDGSVSYLRPSQKKPSFFESMHSRYWRKVDKGERPQPTGITLYKTS